MKTFLHKSPKMILALVGLASVWGLFGTANAQTHQERVYATEQGWKKSGINIGIPLVAPAVQPFVALSGNAISASLKDSSVLSTGSGGLASVLPNLTQYLKFATQVPAGTPIHLKLSLPSGLLNVAGLLGNLDVGTFTNLTSPGTGGGANATITSYYTTGNGLVNLLNGIGTSEIIITPTAACDGVYVNVAALLSANTIVEATTNLFHAYYIDNNVAGDAGCPSPIDVLSGVTASTGIGSVGSAVGSVNGVWNAIDKDGTGKADLTTYATMNVGIAVLNRTYLDALLNVPAKANDSVSVVLQDPGNGVLSLLSLGVLSSLSIQPYMDNTPVGASIPISSGLIRLEILPSVQNIYKVTVPVVDGDFNRIEVRFDGVANVAQGLRVYDISAKVPAPVIDGTTIKKDQYAYVGSTVTLHAATNANGDPIAWFTDSLGTTPVTAINTAASGVQTFYARSSRDGCTAASGVASVKLHISAISNPTLPSGNVGQAYSQVVTADIVAPSDLPNTPVYSFTYVSHTFNPVVMGSSPISNIANRYAMIDMPAVFSAGPMNLGHADMFASIDLGNGLSYNDVTNTIEGTPTTEGTYNVTFDVTDNANGGISAGQITKTFAIAAALPVYLGDFNIHLDNNKNAVLNWETVSEQNTVRFDVMRSNNGTNFTKIKSVEAAGISTTPKSYSYTDNNPGAKSYYRIDIILTNEATSNSKVISISGGRSSGFAINPNPASDKIVITGINSDDIATVSIYDASGRLVQTATNGTINVQALSHGVYFVTVAQKDGTKSNGKFLKK